MHLNCRVHHVAQEYQRPMTHGKPSNTDGPFHVKYLQDYKSETWN